MLVQNATVPSEEHQVVVVGCGLAGLATAIAARQAGADVVVLEKAPVEERGGNTRFSGGVFRAPFPGYTEHQIVDDVMRVSDERADIELVRTMAQHATALVEWLGELGVEFSLGARSDMRGSYYGTVVGGGDQLAEHLAERATAMGVEIRYETAAHELLLDARRAVVGVRAVAADGFHDLLADGGVVLASGGYQANVELRARYFGVGAEGLIVRGTRHNTGEGIMMALQIGAQPAGHWSGYHSAVIDARSARLEAGETNLNAYSFTLLVNLDGERFFDEGSGFHDVTYVRAAKAIQAQPHGLAFCLFDQQVADRDLVVGRDHRLTPIVAGSIRELADRLGVEPDRLEATVEGFNRAVQPGAFDDQRLDGKHTRGIDPPKSNWALTVDRPLFYAYPVTGSCVTFTFAGLKVDARARVLDRTGRPIAGLYAAGELLGDFAFGSLPGGASLARAGVFGRLAGAGAAVRSGQWSAVGGQ